MPCALALGKWTHMKISRSLLQALQRLLGKENVQTDELSLQLNSYDCSQSRHRPDAVVKVTDTAVLPDLVRLLAQAKVPFIARAAATNHAGSCAAVQGGVVINVNALDQIYQIHPQQGYADVAPGVVTAQLQAQLQPLGFFYAPDPASEAVCTLGGNLAQNASGARCMKYGNTADNTLQADLVTPQGYCLSLRHDAPGPDWLGLLAGSEGTLGLIQKMRIKILPQPKQVKTFLTTFDSLENAVQTVSDLAAQGLIPRCVEAMDQTTTRAVEDFAHAGYPTEAQALLILELDGTRQQIARDEKLLQALCQARGCQSFTAAQNEEEREKLWRGRRAAYSAMAALAPSVAVGDGTVPRSELAQTLRQVRRILDRYGVRASLLFHAGDGNFHPQIIFDSRNKEQTHRVSKALQEILKACIDHGGTLSGEHGVGIEKRAVMAYQYSRETLHLMGQIKKALDPDNLANPGKILPVGLEGKVTLQEEDHPEVLRLAGEIKRRAGQREKIRVTGTRTQWKTATAADVSARSLNRILDIDKTNYTATVQAGVKVQELLLALKQQGVYAPLPPDYPGTLGGLISQKRCPQLTPCLTGLQVIVPNGDIIDYGGKLMKNAAGYNLCRLFTGACGTLGLITHVTFKIYAKPVEAQLLPWVWPTRENDPWLRAVQDRLDPQHLFLVEENA